MKAETSAFTPKLEEALRAAVTNRGESLAELSQRQPLLVVLLRHAGCTFCREALADVARRRSEIEAGGTRIALVHLSDDAAIAALAARYGLDDLPRVADSQQALYRAFELRRGGLWQLFGPTVLWRGLRAALLSGHGFGRPRGDVLQMPGVFLIDRGRIVRGYRHRDAADRPDYAELACPMTPH